MQVFKAYYKILKKHIGSVLIYVLLFFMLTVLYSGNIGKDDNLFEADMVPTVIINEDQDSNLIKGFMEYLSQYVKFVKLKEGSSIQDALYFGEVAYVLTIPEGFTEEFLRGEEGKLSKLTAPDSVEAVAVDTAVDNYFHMASVYNSYMPGMSEGQLNTLVQSSLTLETEVSLTNKVLNTVSAGNNFNKFYYNYLGYITIAVFIMCVSIIMFSFHNLDIRRRHAAAPVSSRNMNLQLIMANFIYVVAFMLVFIAAGYILNGNRLININTLLYWLNAMVFAIVALCISYLVGISVSSKKAIAALSTALSLGLAFLSGMFVPQELLGAPVLRVASFTPTYWFVKTNNMIEKVTSTSWDALSGIVGSMLIQLGFAAAILSISLVISKRKRQQAS
jgi:ABC-2 type transport system permease protein